MRKATLVCRYTPRIDLPLTTFRAHASIQHERAEGQDRVNDCCDVSTESAAVREALDRMIEMTPGYRVPPNLPYPCRSMPFWAAS